MGVQLLFRLYYIYEGKKNVTAQLVMVQLSST